MDYAILDERVRRAGLYERTHGWYALHAGAITACCVLILWLLPQVAGSLLGVVLLGLFTGFVFVQAGMLGHDLSHLQVFESPRVNRACSLIMWTFICGLSERGWYEKHNAHHKHVNHVGHDPDLEIPFIFSSVQVAEKPAWVRKWIFPHQSWLFFVMLPLVYPNFVMWSILNVFIRHDRRAIVEGILILLHFVAFIGIPLLFLSVPYALVFWIVSFATIGMYMGMVFAPNHKGEEVVHGRETTWQDQILLTRNIRSNLFTFILFGGLDLQVEHHLFPKMSRYQYPKAQHIVKEFCREAGIEYYETSWWGSMKEIHTALKREAEAHRALV